jgi:hypothetical protein
MNMATKLTLPGRHLFEMGAFDSNLGICGPVPRIISSPGL